MSSISAGTTTGTALVSTGDTTGELVLKTNGGTTAITIDTDQNVTFDGTGSITVPAGTTAERPATPAEGMLRYNTDTNELEKYDGTEWGAVGGAVTPAAVSSQTNTATDYFMIPVGNTDGRPASPAAGMIRFNTTTGEPEWYDPNSSQWLRFYQGSSYDIEILMIGGGGVGGVTIGSGGGAGGLLVGETSVFITTSYDVVIGAGAAIGSDGTSGSDTTFGENLTAYGGAGGVSFGATPGNNGGSGSGGSGNRGGTSLGGLATQDSQGDLTGYGNDGGTGTASGDPIQPGGGGGAGGAGQNGINTGTTKAGDGGIGIYNLFQTGSNIGYAGGGSGNSYNSAASPTDTRDTWGGGVSNLDNTKVNGVANKGGGGGGGGFLYGPAQGAGGSGVVIIRYPGTQRAIGGTVTSYAGYTVHTFTTSGTFTA